MSPKSSGVMSKPKERRRSARVGEVKDITEISEWIPVHASEGDALAILQALPVTDHSRATCPEGVE